MESVLKHPQALTAQPAAMIIQDIKAKNELFHSIPPLLPFEPSIDTKLQKSLMDDLLQSLWAATSNYFTTKYQALKDASYIFQNIQ